MRLLPCFILLIIPALARAGYELPSHMDGCRSADGRFVIAAEPVGKATNHGPNKWQFVWTDSKEKKTVRLDAQGVSGGQVHGQLFIAPDGETFALFNHVTLWYSSKSDMHGATKLWGDKPGYPKDIQHEAFSRRIIVYKKDGSILKELGITDLLNQAELDNVMTVFTRVHWIQEFPGLRYKETPRHGYAFYHVSPDYTVLEVRAVTPRGSKEKSGRVIRVSLTDGKILAADANLEGDKLPVRPYRGPDHLPDQEPTTREGYIPSLDPVREEGKLISQAPPPPAKLTLLKDGFTKLDAPAWVPAAKCLTITDLEPEPGELFRLDENKLVLRDERGRGKVGPDGLWYGLLGDKLVSWNLKDEPKVLLAKAPGDRGLSLNDITVSTLVGGSSDNVIDASGFSGYSALIGEGGNDTLLGGDPPNVLIGGAGNDVLVGGAGTIRGSAARSVCRFRLRTLDDLDRPVHAGQETGHVVGDFGFDTQCASSDIQFSRGAFDFAFEEVISDRIHFQFNFLAGLDASGG